MTEPAVNPYAPPQAVDAPAAPPAALLPGEISQGARIAGGLLIVNAVLAVIEKIAAPSTPSGLVAIAIDVIIGISLLQRNPKWLTWAIVRVALGAVLFPIANLVGGNYLLVALQLMVSGALLMLLIGNPGKPRIAVACSLYGIYTLLEIVGLLSLGSR